MKLCNTIAAIAIGLAATSIGSAQASTIDVDFSGGGVTADLVLNVVGGQAISGTGVLTDSAISATAMSMSLVTLSTPTISNLGGGALSYRFGGGTDLIGDTSVPIDGAGLVFQVATPSSPALQLGANLWSNGGSSYSLFLAGNSLTENGPIVYDQINGTASVSAVPVPAALPLFGSAVVGIAVAARRRLKKMHPTTA